MMPVLRGRDAGASEAIHGRHVIDVGSGRSCGRPCSRISAGKRCASVVFHGVCGVGAAPPSGGSILQVAAGSSRPLPWLAQQRRPLCSPNEAT